jgi:hypothetical protein
VQREIADAVVDQLLELFDERFEAGPADYVLQRANVEGAGDDAAVTVVWRPSLLGPLLGVRRTDLGTGDAEALAWELYRLLEGGSIGVPDEPPAADGIRWVDA